MKAKNSSTAILLFTRDAAHEAAAKSFVNGAEAKKNQQIARALILNSQQEAAKSGLPVFSTLGQEQEGSTFGERMANAIEKVFSAGFQHVIAIGNDCPQLTSSRLLNAEQGFAQSSLVLGPAADGGLYLIGIAREAYARDRFIQLPWETGDLARAYQQLAQTEGQSIHWLEALHDIDRADDLQECLRLLPLNSQIAQHLRRILHAKAPQNSPEAPYFHSNSPLQTQFLRGPPR
ncbi:MAG: DUF2064 domain-containing protein [Bacteroidia bacterium]|nr:DUF2064 domain-containing protein [Bacteroidia bacterium]